MSSFQHLHQSTGRYINDQDRNYLFFGGTAYLSLATDPQYIALYKEGLDRYGINNGTSRSNNIQQGVFAQAEELMAERFAAPGALLLSSGYLAAQLLVRKMISFGTYCYAPKAHPALWLDQAPVASTLSFADWAQQTVHAINASDQNSFVLLSNSLDNLSPERYDFSVFQHIHPAKRICLIIDDSHGIGVGRCNGTFVDGSMFADFPHIELIQVASLAKGMGTDAGVIFASAERIQDLRQSTFYAGASPASPAALYALIQGTEIYARNFEKLHNNAAYLRKQGAGFLKSVESFPVFTLAQHNAFELLMKRNILISSFAYPLPTDPLINRIVVSATHEQADLDKLLAALQSMF